MHSKVTIWNIRDQKCDFYHIGNGVSALFTPDPHIENMVLTKRKQIESDKSILMMGEELTSAWIEDNWESLSLFGGVDSFLILESQKILPSVQEILLSDRIDFANQNILFCFSKKNDFYKQICKKKQWHVFTVEAPPFWKDAEVLTMLCDENNVRLSLDAHHYIIQAVPGTIEDFSILASQLSLLFPSKSELSLEDIKSVLSPYKVDHFYLVGLLAQRKRIDFLKEILSLSLDFPMMEELFRMVQFHFLKLIDTSYATSKAKLSKYDKEIMMHSKLWKKEELERIIIYFKELEYLARTKNIHVRNKLREALMANLIKW